MSLRPNFSQNPTTGVVTYKRGDDQVPLATGGDATSLTTEVNAIETALGLSSSGTWTRVGSTGLLDLITQLEARIAALEAA